MKIDYGNFVEYIHAKIVSGKKEQGLQNFDERPHRRGFRPTHEPCSLVVRPDFKIQHSSAFTELIFAFVHLRKLSFMFKAVLFL